MLGGGQSEEKGVGGVVVVEVREGRRLEFRMGGLYKPVSGG